MKNILTISIILFALSSISFSQPDKEEAERIALQGVEKCDHGFYDEAIRLFDEALLLDSGNFVYIYEKGYAYYMKKDFQTSIDIIEPLLNEDNSIDQFYQLVGNSYDNLGQDEKALQVYNEGIEKFPNSGKLFLERGNFYYQNDNEWNAVDEWEKGIEVDPYFSSNYYNLTLFFSETEEEIWALLYGEIFMNLEKNTERTYEISKLLYDTYSNTIRIIDENEISVSITKNVVYIEPGKPSVDKERFEMYYEIAVAESSIPLIKGFNLKNLYKTRKNFLKYWYDNRLNKDFSNSLINWQKEVLDKGFFKIYNYWLLSLGRVNEFEEWVSKNENEFDKFAEWFVNNNIKLLKSTKYSRMHYHN
ncbi:MAG: hypothetical protein ISS16_08870 [Ignavibacteria bacterium]|nr:hypothetical protein [Bacteroidota bacterium]MBL7129081.1 hypothetical protein [Ignavibacteria bacterium]